MGYEPLRKRMKHQNKALEAAASAPTDPCEDDAFAFVMDYGTGKSQVILDEWGTVATNGGPQDFLCVAPAGSYRNWFMDKSDLQLREIANMDPEFQKQMRVCYWKSGPSRAHREELRKFMSASANSDRPRALFVNIEALSKAGEARELVREYVSQRFCYGVIDESTGIKGRRSERAKFLVRKIAPELDIRRIATGLLTPQAPTDAYMQFKFLSSKIINCRSFQDFQGRYCVTRPMVVNKRTIDVIVDYRELDDLRDRMAPYSFRVLKSECLDLEPKKYVMWEVEHTREQARIYREVRDDAMSLIEGESYVSTDMVMTQVMRLHQINAGYVTDEEGALRYLPSNREKDIVEILGQHRGKAVIWSGLRPPVPRIRAALVEAFGENCVAEFHGGNKGTRAEEEKRFLGDPSCKYMLATPQAAGRGNTWVNADLEIYHCNSPSLEDRYNSEDRLHRKGQTNRVTVLDMVVPETVDIKRLRQLRRKITLATTLTGEEAREWLI